MAVFAVAFDGTRVNAADALTGWTADGVTPELEADFFYQGTGSISAQVKTAEAGFTHTSAAQNMTGRSWICKVYSGKVAGLDGNGLLVRIGSTSGNYYGYQLFIAATYPIVGGWQILAIDPAVTQWRTSTVGSPNLASVTYWNLRADYSATSRSTNTAMDAIDTIANGTGLTGTGGDGADADGTFALFAAGDEGTAANRWGVIQTRNGINYVIGTLSIGSATATVFTDANAVVVFTDQRVTTGFCGIKFSLANASTAISLTNCVLNGRGALTGSDDTRPDYTVTGTSGTLTIAGCTFNGYRLITLTSKPSLQECTFLNGRQIIGAGADLRNSTFQGGVGLSNAGHLVWDVNTDTDGKLDGCTFTIGGVANAIELGTTSPTTITLRNVTFNAGFGSNGQSFAAIRVKRTTGTVTINVVGGTTPTYVSEGATVVIVANPVSATLTVTNPSAVAVQNARVLVTAAVGGPFPSAASVTITSTGGTATVSHGSHGLSTNDKVMIKGASQAAYNGVFTITVTNANEYTYAVAGGPASPATGTITSTFVVLSGLTDVNGQITMSRVFPSNQPITGKVRKATGSPLYKAGSFAGTVLAASGFSGAVQLVADE